MNLFLLNNSLRPVYVVCALQTIEEQKIKFDFYGEMGGHICGLLIYLTLSIYHLHLRYSRSSSVVVSWFSKKIITIIAVIFKGLITKPMILEHHFIKSKYIRAFEKSQKTSAVGEILMWQNHHFLYYNFAAIPYWRFQNASNESYSLQYALWCT